MKPIASTFVFIKQGRISDDKHILTTSKYIIYVDSHQLVS